MKLLSTPIIALLLITGIGKAAEPATNSKRPDKPNVLFIFVDDLRRELNCYGKEHMKTPNIDRLAKQGLLFNQAHCQVAACFPSRVSILSGYRPPAFRFAARLTNHVPKNTVSMPQLFKNAGYTTVSIGKVYHSGNDDKPAWSERKKNWSGWDSGYQLESNRKLERNYLQQMKGKYANVPRPNSIEVVDAPDDKYTDGIVANNSIETLQRLKKEGKPFFLATGFYRPHLPYVIPQKYWDMYKNEDIKLMPNRFPIKKGVTDYSSDELRRYGDIPKKGLIDDKKARDLIHGYYSSVSFTDVQVGRVMAELKRLELDKNTIVVLAGDHGFSLGEHTWWGKWFPYEPSTGTAMMISVPWLPKGSKTSALTELVDIYPSLCELTGVKAPGYLQGSSFVPLISKPDQAWKKAVFSAVPKGAAVRNDRYRLIQHRGNKLALFDHKTDPGETTNLATDPKYKKVLDEMLVLLKAGWHGARPPRQAPVAYPHATASSYVGNYEPARAIDGDLDQEFSWRAQNAPQWLQVDYGKVKTLKGAHVWPYWGNNRHYRYTLETSTDGKTWQQVVDHSKNTKPSTEKGDKHSFKPTQARYLRINMLFNSLNSGLHLVELKGIE